MIVARISGASLYVGYSLLALGRCTRPAALGGFSGQACNLLLAVSIQHGPPVLLGVADDDVVLHGRPGEQLGDLVGGLGHAVGARLQLRGEVARGVCVDFLRVLEQPRNFRGGVRIRRRRESRRRRGITAR